MTEGLPPLSLVKPDAEEALALVERVIKQRLLCTLFGRCRVVYDGRASSTLDLGDRLVVLKPDSTVLVHTDEGKQPVNWQPPASTSQYQAHVVNDQLVVRSTRTNPPEELVVRFQRVTHATGYDVTDAATLTLTGTEEDLRQRILDDPSLLEPGFKPRATERETQAGAIDIYGEDADGAVVVVELKRRRVGPDAVSQLNRYVEAIERDLHSDKPIRGILVAPSLTDTALELLVEYDMEFVSLSPTEPDA
jgi:RecB family endonuclease NucS